MVDLALTAVCVCVWKMVDLALTALCVCVWKMEDLALTAVCVEDGGTSSHSCVCVEDGGPSSHSCVWKMVHFSELCTENGRQLCM